MTQYKMNKLYTLVLVLALSATGMVKAQDVAKFGHVNSQELLSMMPEVAQAEKDLQVFQGQLEKRLQELTAGYQAEIAKFQELPEDTPESTVSDMRDGIIGIEQRIQEYQVNAEKDLVTRRNGLIEPLLTKLQEAIDAVGKENGYTYIFDLSIGSIVYQGGGNDITALVKEKLGITG